MFAPQFPGTGVTTYSLHPGVVDSELCRHFRIMKIPVIKHLAGWVMKNFMKTVEEGCQTTLYCAVSEDVEDHSGLYYRY